MSTAIEQMGKNLEPMSPIAQYMRTSVFSLTILGVLELEFPINDYSTALKFFEDVLLRKNTRFSSIVFQTKKGVKKWKKVEVNLKDHVQVPTFPSNMSTKYYDECFTEYLSNLAKEQLPENKPLWEIHIINYPTNNAAATLIFNIHHSLGDGYSLMSTLLSSLRRADDPLKPLTLPSRRQSNSNSQHNINAPCSFFSRFSHSVYDVLWSVFKSSFNVEDDKSPIRSGEQGVECRPIVMCAATFQIDQIKQIKNALQVTINDVVTGIIFLAARIYMEESSNEKSGNEVMSTALVLLNTRAGGGGYKSVSEMVKRNAEMPWGNRFAWLPVPISKLRRTASPDELEHEINPLEFVRDASRKIKRQRNPATVYLTAQFLNLVRKLRGTEAAARYMHASLKNTSMAISNMIGPVEQMALSKDHPVKGLYFAVAGSPQSIFVSIVSYAGEMRVAMTVEKDFINPIKFQSCIGYAFKTIYKAALGSPPSTN